MKKYFMGMGVSLLAIGIIFLLFSTEGPQEIYKGKEAFWTTEEYTTFREFLAKDYVKDFKITVLQSEMPIIVKLEKIVVEKGSYCPYGKMGWKAPFAPWMLYTGIPMATVGVALVFKAPE